MYDCKTRPLFWLTTTAPFDRDSREQQIVNRMGRDLRYDRMNARRDFEE